MTYLNYGPILSFFSKEPRPIFQFSPTLASKLLQNLNGNLKINDILSCKEATLAGLGVCILPVDVVEQEIAIDKLKRILPELTLPLMSLFAVYPSHHWMPPKLKVFLEFLETWKR